MDYPLKSASKIFDYFYFQAIKEFDDTTAKMLAQIPADYVYNSLKNKNCVSEQCCLEYCNDLLDSEFNNLTPEVKRSIYERAFNVQTNVSDSEIDMRLKAKRRKFKNDYYYSRARKLKETSLNNLISGMNTITLKRKPLQESTNLLKSLKLN
jgi:hypothetical protein